MRNLPRKLKKKYLGLKLNKSKLRNKLSKVIIYESAHTCYDVPNMNCEPFCPHCGCKVTYTVDHGAAYPEVWVSEICSRCDNTVGYIDNSPYTHALECKDNDYDPTF